MASALYNAGGLRRAIHRRRQVGPKLSDWSPNGATSSCSIRADATCPSSFALVDFSAGPKQPGQAWQRCGCTRYARSSQASERPAACRPYRRQRGTVAIVVADAVARPSILRARVLLAPPRRVRNQRPVLSSGTGRTHFAAIWVARSHEAEWKHRMCRQYPAKRSKRSKAEYVR